MSRSVNQKFKALALYHLLLAQTDEKNPMPVSRIIQELARQDIHAERKSLYDDIAGLQRMGLDVRYRNGIGGGWFVKERPFQLAELKLLIDAVQAARFLTQKKSESLIVKLTSLTSVHQARQLRRQVYLHRRSKSLNESIYANVEKLHTAIHSNRVTTFAYLHYDMETKRVSYHSGQRCTVSPKGLVWSDQNYYLIGWDHRKQAFQHYRIDKMQDIICTGMPQVELKQPFDPVAYSEKQFGMCCGRETQVCLRGNAMLSEVMLERFGPDIFLMPDGKEHFMLRVEVAVSAHFWAWLVALGQSVQLIEPYWAVREFHDYLRSICALYRL